MLSKNKSIKKSNKSIELPNLYCKYCDKYCFIDCPLFGGIRGERYFIASKGVGKGSSNFLKKLLKNGVYFFENGKLSIKKH